MNVPPELFGDDYLYFTGELLERRSDADAELVTRVLGLEPGMRVLDAPCGHGRIAGRLARDGCEVTGIDANERFLSIAREAWPKVTFARGDMRALPFEAGFDALVNWFTSFGYFDRETNDAVLAGFAKALRPGGRLLLELSNPGWLRRLTEFTGGSTVSLAERDGDLMVDRVTYDDSEGFSRTERFVVRGGRVRRLEFTLEQIPARQLVERLLAAGFEHVELFGQGGSKYEEDGRRLIAVAQRP